MMPSSSGDRAWALLFARSVLGLIFLMAGVFKVFQLGVLEHARRFFVEPYADTFLPAWSLWLTGALVPIVELLAGVLIVIGLFTRPALIALGLVLVLVTFGHLLKEPFFEFHTHVIPRLALVAFILMVPRDADRFGGDALVHSLRNPRG